MSRSDEQLLITVIVVFVLGCILSGFVRWVQRASRRQLSVDSSASAPLPGGFILGLLECYFYLAVFSIEGAGYLAGAWLAFKVATKWQSAPWAKPTEQETRVGYRAFQVGTIGTLLVGLLGAALLQA